MSSDAFDRFQQRMKGDIDPRPSQAAVTGDDPSLSVQGGGEGALVIPPPPEIYQPWEMKKAGDRLPFVVFHKTGGSGARVPLHLYDGDDFMALDEGITSLVITYTTRVIEIMGRHIEPLGYQLAAAKISRVWAYDPAQWHQEPPRDAPIITDIQIKTRG